MIPPGIYVDRYDLAGSIAGLIVDESETRALMFYVLSLNARTGFREPLYRNDETWSLTSVGRFSGLLTMLQKCLSMIISRTELGLSVHWCLQSKHRTLRTQAEW